MAKQCPCGIASLSPRQLSLALASSRAAGGCSQACKHQTDVGFFTRTCRNRQSWGAPSSHRSWEPPSSCASAQQHSTAQHVQVLIYRLPPAAVQRRSSANDAPPENMERLTVLTKPGKRAAVGQLRAVAGRDVGVKRRQRGVLASLCRPGHLVHARMREACTGNLSSRLEEGRSSLHQPSLPCIILPVLQTGASCAAPSSRVACAGTRAASARRWATCCECTTGTTCAASRWGRGYSRLMEFRVGRH